MPTIRCEFHRLRAGRDAPGRSEVGSIGVAGLRRDGFGRARGRGPRSETGDLFVVPSWVAWSLEPMTEFDLFRFNDGRSWTA